jgi:HK97 gp10 family phage protein
MPKKYRLDKLEVPSLEEAEPKIRRKVMRQAVKVVAIKARALAPDSGNSHRGMKMGVKGKLNRSIKYTVLDRGLTGKVAAKAPHAHLVHDGTQRHLIPAPKDLDKRKRAFPLYAGGRPVTHPGARAQPFLIEAEQQVHGEVERVLRDGAEEALREVAGG